MPPQLCRIGGWHENERNSSTVVYSTSNCHTLQSMATCHLFSVVLIKRIAMIDLRLGASLFGVCSNFKPHYSTIRNCRPFSKSIRSIVFDKTAAMRRSFCYTSLSFQTVWLAFLARTSWLRGVCCWSQASMSHGFFAWVIIRRRCRQSRRRSRSRLRSGRNLRVRRSDNESWVLLVDTFRSDSMSNFAGRLVVRTGQRRKINSTFVSDCAVNVSFFCEAAE